MEEAVVVAINKRQDNMHEPYNTLWRMSVIDAIKICSDKRTSGLNHFLAWFRISDIINKDHFKFVKDDGRYKKIIRDLEVEILGYNII